MLETRRFEHLMFDRAARTDEPNAAARLFASQAVGDGNAWGKVPASAASSEDVQRRGRLRVDVIAQ